MNRAASIFSSIGIFGQAGNLPAVSFFAVGSSLRCTSKWNYQVTAVGNSSALLITIEFIESSGATSLFKRLLRPIFGRLILNQIIDNFCAGVEHKQASTI